MICSSTPHRLWIGTLGLALLLGFACRSTSPQEKLDAHLESSISDSTQREPLSRLVERRREARDSYWSERSELANQIQRVNADYTSQPELMADTLAGFDSSWETYRDEVIDVALEMRGLMSEDEWHAFSAVEIEAILVRPESNKQ